MDTDIEYAFWLANRAANDRAIEAFQNGIDPAPPLLRDWIKYVLGHLAASLQAPRQRKECCHGLGGGCARAHWFNYAIPFGCPSQSQ
jgi:hypothetical protein